MEGSTIHAIIADINKYQSFQHLRSAVSDAAKVQQVLEDELKANIVDFLDDEKATKAGILESISSLPRKVKRNDAIIFFFSGYAAYAGRLQDEGGPVGIICPVDVFAEGGISDKSLMQAFDQVAKSCGNNIVRCLCLHWPLISLTFIVSYRQFFWTVRPKF